MAKLYSYLICAIIFFIAGRWIFADDDPPVHENRVAVRLAETAAQAAQINAEKRIVFIGDSIMASLATASISPNSINLALSGDTAEALSKRLHHYRFAAGSRCAVIAIGINDLRIRKTPKNTAAAIEQIIDALAATKLTLVSEVLPTLEVDTHATPNAIRRLNNALEERCATNPRCTVVKAHDNLANSNGRLLDIYSLDGLHLSDKGYAVWRNVLSAALQEAGCVDE